MFPTIRTGIVGEVQASEASNDLINTVTALLRVFMKDAIEVAGRYTIAHKRRRVTGRDMRGALMYCARTFFDQKSDVELDTLVTQEKLEMDEEESEEESEEEGEEDGEDEDEGEGEGEGEDEEGEEEDDEEEDDEEDEEEGEDPTEADICLARNVDDVVMRWPLWQPEDPVHQLIKRSIDQTPL